MMNIIPILLGTDVNTYGIARSLHQAYGLHSIAVGKYPMPATRHSRIVQVHTFPHFDTDEVFVPTLLKVKKKLSHTGKDLLLIPCGDGYNTLAAQHQAELREHFLFNFPSLELTNQLENKKDFYQVCETYGLDYPSTVIVNKDNFRHIKLPFGFPVALKANDSIDWINLSFPGKKKAYTITSQADLEKEIAAGYEAGYTGEMIIQDFIPGDTSKMYVLNAYVNTHGHVTMMALGKCLLDECFPTMVGNYTALTPVSNDKIYAQYQKFLEDIHYTGYANFDLKFDERDGTFKVFEINLRPGASSFFTTASGCNFLTYLVEDLVRHQDQPTYYHDGQGLWLSVDPLVVKKYCSPDDRELVKKLLHQGFTFTQWYDKDRSFSRFADFMRRRLSTIRYYRRYATKR